MGIMGAEDPDSFCVLAIHFTSGTPMTLRTRVGLAREAIKEWRKFMLWASMGEIERSQEEKPMFLYYFLCANRESDICGAFLMQNVCGMLYYVENEEKK